MSFLHQLKLKVPTRTLTNTKSKTTANHGIRITRVVPACSYTTTTTTTTTIHTQLPPLPPIPPRIKTRPTPWLTQREINEYLLPLKRHTPAWVVRCGVSSGRFLRFFERGCGSAKARRELGGGGEGRCVGRRGGGGLGMMLSGLYRFENRELAEAFVRDVRGVGRKEKHDPDVLVIEGEGEGEGERPVVRVMMRTHEACLGEEVLGLWDGLGRSDTEINSSTIVPGLTMRDIRFAYIIHSIYTSSYQNQSTSTTSSSSSNTTYNPHTLRSPLAHRRSRHGVLARTPHGTRIKVLPDAETIIRKALYSYFGR